MGRGASGTRACRVGLALCLFGCALAADALAGPVSGPHEPGRGMLLVATRKVTDPNFSRTVVLLLRHGERGAFGLVINRPTEVEPHEVLPEIKKLKQYGEQLYSGGPVHPDRYLLLLRSDDPPDGMREVFPRVHAGDSRELLEKLVKQRKTRRGLRIYAGSAGWAPGQLENEIRRGDWHVIPAEAELVFAADPAGVWKQLDRPVAAPRRVTRVERERGDGSS